MLNVTVCIGSCCHLKGSKYVVETFQNLIKKNNAENKIKLFGKFCMKNCQNGVCVAVENEIFSVTPETAEEFFAKNILCKAKD